MFSIIIPLFNKELTIFRTVSSVLSQTIDDYEIIIIDDGSTDKSLDIINSKFNDNRIKVFSQKNSGVSSARNHGAQKSNFNHIMFLDADDELLPNYLFFMKNAIRKYPDKSMYGSSSCHRDYLTGKSDDATIAKYKDKILCIDYFENPDVVFHISAVVFSKKYFFLINNSYDGFPLDIKYCEDLTCMYKMAMLQEVVYIGFPLSIRHNNVEGQTTGLSEEERQKNYIHVSRYFNSVYFFYSNYKENKLNKKFIKFLKVNIRGRVLSELKKKNHLTVQIFLNNLDDKLKLIFEKFEFELYLNEKLRFISIIIIYFYIFLWKTNRYPE